MPPLRITFVTPQPTLNGGIRVVAEYAQRLADRGHDVTIVSTGPFVLSPWRRLKNLLKGAGWWRPHRGPSHFDSLTSVKRKVLSKYKPITDRDVPDADVIIATWWETAEWISSLSEAKGAPIYFVQHHEVVFDHQPLDRVRASYKLPMPKICVAKWLKDVMAREYGDATATHIPIGVDHSILNAPPRGKQAVPTVGMMYARTKFKGIDVAARAIELARERIPNLRVIAFGEHPATDDCKIPDDITVEIRPSQQRIAEMYASCDAWLFPSRCEGFGLPVIEAMACRTPVIGTPTGIGTEVLNEASGGLLVPIEDAGAMAEAIVRIVEMDEAEWRRLSDAALATAARFRWDSSVLAFEDRLQKAAADASRAKPRDVVAVGSDETASNGR